MKIVWLSLGLISLAIGAVGIFLPLLPTVPFLLLSAICFGRSSERLHNWLLTHPIYGPPIQNWQERGAISRRAKLLATGSILAGIVVGVAVGLSPLLLATQATVLTLTLLFIWTRPGA